MTEVWRFIPGSDTHEVSTLGRVRSWVRRYRREHLDAPVLLRPRWCLNYLMVNVTINGRSCSRYVHRLVLETHVGPAPERTLCCHFPDSNTTNCALGNLRWDTRPSNGLDTAAQNRGLSAIAERLALLQAEHPHLCAQPNQGVPNPSQFVRTSKDTDHFVEASC